MIDGSTSVNDFQFVISF